MSLIRFLHISDLHFNKTGFETETMREKLIPYVSTLSQNGTPFDYIFFTGDLRFAPYVDYPSSAIDYFNQLCSCANVHKDNLFVTLGNHDILRDNSDRLSAISKLENDYYDNDRVIENSIIPSLKSGREAYYPILQQIISSKQFNSHTDNSTLHFVVKTSDLNIVIVDSTITYRKNKENDFLIGAYNLKKVLDNCDVDKPTIILSHYALDSLEPAEQRAILRTLKDHHVQMWLAGHKHNDIIRKEMDYVFTAQSGNLTFEQRTRPGFVECVLDVENGSGYFHVHKWNESSDWGLYQTLVDNTDKRNAIGNVDKTKYYFLLNDWPTANNTTDVCGSELTYKILAFLKNYNGNSFFAETLSNFLNISEEKLLVSLKELSKLGYIKPVSYKKHHWEILKR